MTKSELKLALIIGVIIALVVGFLLGRYILQ